MPEVRYMRKKGESAVHIATEWLEKRDDMEFCDPIVPEPEIRNPKSEIQVPVTKDERPLEQVEVNVNVPRDAIYEASLAQKNYALDSDRELVLVTSEKINNNPKSEIQNFVCTAEGCFKSFQNARALHMHGLGAHRVGRAVNV